MKRILFSVFTSLAAIVFLGACEQHSWEDTKHLTQPHGDHDSSGGHDAHAGENDAHDKDGGHAEKKGH